MSLNQSEFKLPKGSLYSPFPIPAYKVLGSAKEYVAQRVLLALISFMGKSNNVVYPSYSTLCRTAGVSRKSVSLGLSVLTEYGFIKIQRFRDGKKARSKYCLQLCCWDSGKMDHIGRKFSKLIARCKACGEGISRAEFDFSPIGKVHWGCGGLVVYLKSHVEKRPESDS